MASTSVVLFCDNFEETDIKWLSDNIDCLSSATVILTVNASDTLLQQISHNVDIIKIKQTNILTAFFKAKEIIDNRMSMVVKLICSQKLASYIESLCTELLPPIFTWNIVVPPNSKKSDLVPYDNLGIPSFLKSLPGDGDINILQSKLIPQDIFYHGFSTRTGGISKVSGLKSLNLVYSNSKQDSHAVIAENRRRLAEKAGFDNSGLQVTCGVHGNTVHVIGKATPEDGYDGIITNQHGYTCGASAADCIVMLFADPVKKVCGAIHSGWKGTLAKICVETLLKMKECFGSHPEDIIVVIGPSACEKCYEFGVEDSKQFTEMCPESVVYRQGAKKPTIDLKLANRFLLQENKVKPGHIDDKSVALCTMENPELFFSFRRDGRPFGSQIGFIGLK